MSGIIPRIFIKDLLSCTNIVDIINIRITLKKKGNNFQAYCPFHHEKTPSFTVNAEKQFFYCFGCRAHGNIIDFLMKHDKLEFIEAIEELADQNNLKIPYKFHNNKNYEIYNYKKNMYGLMSNINKFYQKTLELQIKEKAYQYIKKRGLNKTVIIDFAIGFSPSGGNNIINNFGHSAKNITMLDDAGMIITTQYGKIYDRFQERIMFPIRNKSGKIIAFGGRVIGDKQPKYLNSPETKIYNKGKELYGLYEAKQNNSKLPRILIVEGYMDVITLAQFGINYAVSSLGTSTTSEHIKLLYQSTDKIICCYDGDKAGREAAWHSLNITLPHLIDGKEIYFTFLPEGEDPDTLIRKIGKTSFENYTEQAQPLSKFLLRTLIPQVNLSTPEGRAKLFSLVLPFINQIPGEALRICLCKYLGNKIGIIDDYLLKKMLLNLHVKKDILSKPLLKRTNMRILIGLLVQNPQLCNLIPTTYDLEKAFYQPGMPLFIEIIKICKFYKILNTGQLLEIYREKKYYDHLKTLAIWDHMITDKIIEKIFIDNLSYLYNSTLKQRQELLISRDRTHGLTNEERHEIWSLNKILAKI